LFLMRILVRIMLKSQYWVVQMTSHKLWQARDGHYHKPLLIVIVCHCYLLWMMNIMFQKMIRRVVNVKKKCTYLWRKYGRIQLWIFSFQRLKDFWMMDQFVVWIEAVVVLSIIINIFFVKQYSSIKMSFENFLL
jgi:hypothetical protein